MADRAELAGEAIFKKFAIGSTPSAVVLDGDGAEVDWFIGYTPPPENYQAKLEKILRGEGTFKALQAAYAANPKDVAAVFGLARKWEARNNTPKAREKYQEVIALDPEGKAGSYTDEDSWVTAPFAEYARASCWRWRTSEAAIPTWRRSRPSLRRIRRAGSSGSPTWRWPDIIRAAHRGRKPTTSSPSMRPAFPTTRRPPPCGCSE
ncbi:MAG: hypothetical protein M0C28_48175 [Candidatus Moduliflexus flocculans]|nr:hypothetical protein [Candidatus Moduliflexus flocculans]